jgi:4-hydroxy-tetrahydrodipicolinate synthase
MYIVSFRLIVASQLEIHRAGGTAAILPDVLCGIIPPLVTPLTETGNLDSPAFAGLIERVIAAGAHGLFLLGSTGEFCSLSSRMRETVVRAGCETASGRVPVVVNVSDTSLDESLHLARKAASSGAVAVAICPPYYYAITQADLQRYAMKFADRAGLPVFLYNIPQNAGVEFEVETVRRLADHPNIVGLKNSNGRLDYAAGVSRVKTAHPSFSLLVGTEETMMSAMELGADGGVCGGANMFPSLYVELYKCMVEGRREEAEHVQKLIVRVAEAVYTVGSASTGYLRGLKGALAYLGVCSDSLAEPLESLNEEEQRELRSRLVELLPVIGERN